MISLHIMLYHNFMIFNLLIFISSILPAELKFPQPEFLHLYIEFNLLSMTFFLVK